MYLRKTLVAIALVAAATLALVPAAPAVAQEVVQDEGEAYRAWYVASQAKDFAKALEAGRAYLAQYPTGQYAAAIGKWLPPYEFDGAIKEKRTADAIKFGRQLLSADPDNLRVLYQLAFSIRANELLAVPPVYDHAADATEFSGKAIGLIEAGKTLEGAPNFTKTAALSWLTQVRAIVEAKNGNLDEAVKLYENSTALGLDNPQVAGRNLLAINSIRQAAYTAALTELKAVPDADKSAAEPKPEVKAIIDRIKQRADAFIDSAASFVAYAKVKGIAAKQREQVNETLTQVYTSLYRDDATRAGLQKILAEKEAALGGAPPPGD